MEFLYDLATKARTQAEQVTGNSVRYLQLQPGLQGTTLPVVHITYKDNVPTEIGVETHAQAEQPYNHDTLSQVLWLMKRPRVIHFRSGDKREEKFDLAIDDSSQPYAAWRARR